MDRVQCLLSPRRFTLVDHGSCNSGSILPPIHHQGEEYSKEQYQVQQNNHEESNTPDNDDDDDSRCNNDEMDETTPLLANGASSLWTPSHDLSVFPSDLKGKRILLCTESFGPVNGVSRTTLMLVNHLRSNGAHVAVVAPHNHTKVNTFTPVSNPITATTKLEGSSDLTTTSIHYTPEIRLTGYPLPVNPELSVVYPVRLSTLYARTFGGGLDQHRDGSSSPNNPPDLIYLASPASLGFQVMLQLRKHPAASRVPLLCNFQTDLSGYCEILFPHPLGKMASLVFDAVQGYLFRHESVKRIFYPSRFVRRYLEGRCGVVDNNDNGDGNNNNNNRTTTNNKLDVLRRGVNTEGFNPGKRSEELRRKWAPEGELILFTCSRIAAEKGYGFLARVVEELDKKGLRFKLVIVGGNRNPVVEREVRDMFLTSKKKKNNSKVIFTGFKVGEELMTHYASADVFLHCSVTETFGLVVLEAMASGVPVVARDEGGPSDIIDDGDTGYLVRPDDLGGFVDKVMKLGYNTALRERFSRAGRAAASEATWEKIGNKVAWGMADAIEQRRRDDEQRRRRELEEVAALMKSPWPVRRARMTAAAVRKFVEDQLVNTKLVLGGVVILGVWVAVGAYLVFLKATQWFKTRGVALRKKFRWRESV